MPKIIEITGIQPRQTAPTQQDVQSELKQRAALVTPSAEVDTINLSEGEMRLYLLAQRDLMLSQFWQGTPQGATYARDFEQKRDVLYNGLHTLGLDFAGLRLASQPASGWSGWADKGRNPSAGIQQLFQDAPAVGAIPQLNCNTLFPILTMQQWTAQGAPESVYFNYVQDQQAKRTACQTENLWRTSLNSYWEKSANALLYQFLTINNSIPGIVGAKASIQQETYFNTIQGASKISRANLELWLSNGIMANSIIGFNGQSLGPQTPQGFIEGLKENASVDGFAESLVKVAIGCLQNTFNQFKIFVDVLKGNITLKQGIQAHITNIELFFKDNLSDVKMLANNKDWEYDPNNPPIDCEPGFVFDPSTAACIPIPETGNGGGNFWGNLTQSQKIGLGVAAAGAALLLTRK